MKALLSFAAVMAVGVAGVAFAEPVQPRPGRIEIDSNGDKFVSRDEAEAHASAMFARLDIDGNRILNEADRDARRERREARRGDEEGPRMGRRHGHGGPHQMARMAMMAKEADLNGDNGLSQSEFVTMSLRLFDAQDVNGDRRIELPERPERPARP